MFQYTVFKNVHGVLVQSLRVWWYSKLFAIIIIMYTVPMHLVCHPLSRSVTQIFQCHFGHLPSFIESSQILIVLLAWILAHQGIISIAGTASMVYPLASTPISRSYNIDTISNNVGKHTHEGITTPHQAIYEPKLRPICTSVQVMNGMPFEPHVVRSVLGQRSPVRRDTREL